MKKSIALLVALMLCLVAFSACTKDEQESAPAKTEAKTGTEEEAKETAETTEEESAEPVEIRYMSADTAGSVSYEVINRALAKFEEENPNVTVVLDSQPSKELRTKLTVEYAAGNPPDASWCILSYAREFMKDDLILDWQTVYDDPRHEEMKTWFSEAVLTYSNFGDGRLMMMPTEMSMDALYCNSEIFEQYGWDYPETFEDYVQLAKDCREEGLYATVTGGKDIRFAWVASAYLARTGGLENANALALGDAMTKWDDPAFGFPLAMEKFSEFCEAGGYPEGTLGFSGTDADQYFVDGKAATFYEGAWKPGNWINMGGVEFLDKLVRVPFPTISENGDADVNVGGAIIGQIIAAEIDEARTQATIEMLKALQGPDFWIEVVEAGGQIPAGSFDFDITKLPAITRTLYEDFQATPAFIPSMDAFAPPAVDLTIKKTAMPGILSGELTVEEAIAEVQAAAVEYASSQE